MKKIHLYLLLTLLLLCESTLLWSQNKPAKFATLYLYRPKKMLGAPIKFTVHMDSPDITGKELKKMRNNSFFIIKLYTEGQTTFYAKTEVKESVMVNVKYGEKYYLRCSMVPGLTFPRPKLEFIETAKGEKEFD